MMRYQLIQTAERLELHDSENPKMGAVYVDFVEGKARHRREFGGGKGQDIAKAIGLNKYSNPTVVDATAGLGRESFVLASLGCNVIMLERNPTVFALLADGFKRAQQCDDAVLQDIIQRMTLLNTSAQDWLSTLTPPSILMSFILTPCFPNDKNPHWYKKKCGFFTVSWAMMTMMLT